MTRCKKQHILFDAINNANTNYQAISVYCGQMLEDKRIWYCSEACMEKDLKEIYRIFWMVKGHLNCSPETAFEVYSEYFERLWGNHEAVIHEEGFEEAWKKRCLQTQKKVVE